MFFGLGHVGRQGIAAKVGGAIVSSSPTLDLVFNGPTLDPQLTFTRASTATYFDSSGTMQTAAVNAARFDYDPVTLALRGLLIEEQRTNFTLNSNAPALLSGGATIAPSVDLPPLFSPATIYKHTITSNPARGYVAITGLTASTAYAFSFWAYVPVSVTTPQGSTLYNNTGEGLTGTQNIALPYQYDMSRKGTWQRLVVGYTTGSAETSLNAFFMRGLLTGDVFYTTCFQCEAGPFATSYIPTTAAAATRSIEVCQMPTGAWYNPNTYSLAMDFIVYRGTVTIGGLSDAAFGANTTYLNVDANPNIAMVRATATTAFAPGAVGLGTVNKACGTMTASSAVNCAVNGSVGGGNTIALGAQSATRLAIGNDPWSLSSAINGYMRRVRYWPRVLSNSELQSVTT